MSFTFLDDADAAAPRAAKLTDRLRAHDRIALDLEAAGFHRYSDRLSLVQLSLPDETFILDPLAFDVAPILRPALEDPDVEVIMHGADFDLRLLDRDLEIHLRGLFDTQAAASLTGETALGLSSLLEKHLGVKLSKKYQRADWARRPLPEDMLEYAAADTRHLFEIADILVDRLEELGRMEWARNEFREMEGLRWEDTGDEDPVTRVKKARDLDDRDLAKLREALEWRDTIARERDRAPFRIAHDNVLVDAVLARPKNVDELVNLQGFNGNLAREEGPDLIARFERVDALPADELVGYPPRDRSGPGRPPPEVEELMLRLKTVRNRRAEELGIDRGTLLSNAVLLEIARHGPSSREDLEDVPGIKRWQVEALGEGLLARIP